MIHYVYFHKTLDTNEIFYVGKGSGNRAFTKKGRNIFWKRVVCKHGFASQIIESFISEKEALDFEIQEIKRLKSEGIRLCNLTDGGEGCVNPSMEVRLKMSKTHKGKIPWNKGKSGSQIPWNKGLKNKQIAWNKNIQMKQSSKEKLRKTNQKYMFSTPNGLFSTVYEASSYFKCSIGTIYNRCESKSFLDWYYVFVESI